MGASSRVKNPQLSAHVGCRLKNLACQNNLKKEENLNLHKQQNSWKP